VPRVQETSPAARRFSEFVSPRLLAANPVEELHKPRLNVAEFSGETAYPVADAIDPASGGTPADPARAIARDTAAEVQPAEAARPAGQQMQPAAQVEAGAQPSANQASRAGERASPDGSTSWVRIVFLTWGGLLTLGSALRLLIG
jgi:hypothetical protein